MPSNKRPTKNTLRCIHPVVPQDALHDEEPISSHVVFERKKKRRVTKSTILFISSTFILMMLITVQSAIKNFTLTIDIVADGGKNVESNMKHRKNDQESTTNDTKLTEFSPTALNPQISRQDVMAIMQKMLSGSYINRNYFQYILQQSKDLLHSIDPVYYVEYPLTNGTSVDTPKVTVSSSLPLKYLQFPKQLTASVNL